MGIKAIGFDWTGVIFQIPGKSFPQNAADLLGVSVTEFQRAYFQHNHMVNVGAATTSYVDALPMWQLILGDLHKEDEIDRFMDMVRHVPKGAVNVHMLDLVDELRRKGLKVGMLSNNSAEVAREFRVSPYAAHFDAAIFSGEINTMKPHREAFEALAQALGVDVTELLFIDDSQRSLAYADEIGYAPILFTGIDDLRRQLAAAQILP